MEGNITAEEKEQLSEAAETYSTKEWEEILEPLAQTTLPDESFDIKNWEKEIQFILGHKEHEEDTKNTKVIPLYRRSIFKYIAAASVILIASLIVILSLSKNDNVGQPPTTAKQDVSPGSFKARLTLADGSVIVLDSAAAGELTKQGNVAVINKDGKLVYAMSPAGGGGLNESPNNKRPGVDYNVLSTANGESYSVTLSDGTKVWLNAASSIKFPVAFTGNERKVEITGEAFFEVVHNAAKPFKVLVNGMEVEDLGTEFNINAYTDEPVVSTTLISGKARVTQLSPAGGGGLNDSPNDKRPGVDLKPGQQATINQANPKISRTENNERQNQTKIQRVIEVQTIDVDKVVSWKTNEFNFSDDNIQTIMRQLARWYNIQPVITAPSENTYTGRITRSVPLSQVLKMFEQLGYVKFEIKDRVVRVIPTQ
jgi:ferric-dicitrate binding protein FerR (iron transport regulator)